MQLIVQIKFGSHLYGTDTPNSDLDIKGIYMPEARDILLQSVKPVVSLSKPKAPGEKNTSADVDYELYSPKKFLDLLAEGQTVALDMLFAPESAMLSPPTEEWLKIKTLAPKLLNKQVLSFVRYCKQQANKYCIKESRAAAARVALEFLNQAENRYGSTAKLAVVAAELKSLVHNNEFLAVGEDIGINSNPTQYFKICDKKVLLNASIKSACAIAQRLMDEYGKRALAAEKNEGIDWKALSHAVRVGHEAVEFMTTGLITFPRPEAKHLLDIKQGFLPFQQVSEEIEKLLGEVESANFVSSLPDSFDPMVIDDFIERLHRTVVLNEVQR